VDALRPGLWRWTTRHPDWVPAAQPGSPADWPPEVGSVAHAAEDALVLIDPLVPEELWPRLDRLVARHGPRVAVLTTIGWHRRSRDEVASRYDATTSRARSSLPRGVETIPLRGFGETMVWLPGPRALVPGDRLLGDGAGGLRLCPESWLRYLTRKPSLSELREALLPLLELPVELVLTSHGEPVLKRGRDALARALR
jgi:glyoxylase-like metal-dependent hydrolase (beta-lactamase superfamily II)